MNKSAALSFCFYFTLRYKTIYVYVYLMFMWYLCSKVSSVSKPSFKLELQDRKSHQKQIETRVSNTDYNQ